MVRNGTMARCWQRAGAFGYLRRQSAFPLPSFCGRAWEGRRFACQRHFSFSSGGGRERRWPEDGRVHFPAVTRMACRAAAARQAEREWRHALSSLGGREACASCAGIKAGNRARVRMEPSRKREGRPGRPVHGHTWKNSRRPPGQRRAGATGRLRREPARGAARIDGLGNPGQ